MNVATIDNPHSGLARQPPPEPKLEAATKERLALARQHRDMLYNIKMGKDALPMERKGNVRVKPDVPVSDHAGEQAARLRRALRRWCD